MNENGKKRREWVKTAAIIFLSVMLVLTFFSNTIMNYSLPEVAAQYVQSGTITAKIRGSGMVESNDPYNVMVKETRKVASVAVKSGDEVQKGDVLVYLEDSESEELKAALQELEAAQEAYDMAILAADVNNQIINNSNSGISTTTYRQQISNAQAEVEKAQREVDEWTDKSNDFKTQIAITPENGADITEETNALNEATNAKQNVELAKAEAETWLANVSDMINYHENSVSMNDVDIAGLYQQKQDAEQVIMNYEIALRNAELAYTRAETALNNKKASGDNAGNLANLREQQAVVEVNLEAANRKLAEKEADLQELTGNIAKTLNLENLYDAIVDAREKVAEQEEKSIGGTVTAEIAGTIATINAVAGKEISAMEAVAIIQPEGKGYTMSFSVTNEQAKRLSVGDVAELVNSWRYDDVTVILSSIKPDPTAPGQKKLLTFDVSGSVVAGQTLNISVGQKSANYDLIVPNSAIREDNNGKFVLTVESKSSPLGNRYIATRVDVEVLASDDTQSAISGALYGYEFIITTSNKPVEAGKQVRLPEN